ncbi:MAG TPA: hypothetical protein VMZ53_33605 [Kofleriaceae bacterium]|nr:hypothetical protein [Kofleriaceae bacterium]
MKIASLFLLVLLLGACGDGAPGKPDARVVPDVAPTPDTPPQPYRHVIMIDGTDDFSPTELFATTSASFTARIAWDDDNLYVAYEGPDLATTTSDADKKWLFVYLDTAAGGETQSEQYNTQRVTFPGTFAADYYARYKVDGTFASLQHGSGGTWTTATPAPTTAQSGMFVELAIPLAAIGAGTSLDLVTYMINEKALAEGTFAGLYAGNFADGYAVNTQLTTYLHVDFTSQRTPNDAANKRP